MDAEGSTYLRDCKTDKTVVNKEDPRLTSNVAPLQSYVTENERSIVLLRQRDDVTELRAHSDKVSLSP